MLWSNRTHMGRLSCGNANLKTSRIWGVLVKPDLSHTLITVSGAISRSLNLLKAAFTWHRHVIQVCAHSHEHQSSGFKSSASLYRTKHLIIKVLLWRWLKPNISRKTEMCKVRIFICYFHFFSHSSRSEYGSDAKFIL